MDELAVGAVLIAGTAVWWYWWRERVQAIRYEVWRWDQLRGRCGELDDL